MPKVSGRFATLFAAAVLAASIPLTASAQLADVVESDASSAQLVVHYGALYTDVREALAPYVPVGSELPTLQAIARDNRGRMLYVCYDQPAGSRPSLSRERGSYDACTARREIWFVAGTRPFLIRFRRTALLAGELPPSYTELQEQIRTRDETLARRETELRSAHDREVELEQRLEAADHRAARPVSVTAPVTVTVPESEPDFDWGGLILSLLILAALIVLGFYTAKHFKAEWEKAAEERGALRVRVHAKDVLKRNRKVIDKRSGEVLDLNERLHQTELQRVELEREMTRSKTEIELLEKRIAASEARKKAIAEAFDEKAKYRPLEKRIFQLRREIDLLKKMRETSEDGPFARFTTPTLDAMIGEAEAELVGMQPKPSAVLEKMDELRSRIASLLMEAVGFYDDSLALDGDIQREKEQLEDLQLEADKRKRIYGQLFTELLKASSEIMPLRQTAIEERARLEAERELLQQEMKLVGDERDAMQAERQMYEGEITRLEGELKASRRETGELRKKLAAEESRSILGLIEEELKTPKAQARNKGALRGLQTRIAELEEFIVDAQAAFQKKHHDFLESNKERIRLRGLLAEKEMELVQLRPKKQLVVVGYDEKPPSPGEPSPTHH